MEIYVINPDNNKPVSVEEWKKESDPTRAEFVAISVTGGILVIKKKRLRASYTFEEAEKACADLEPFCGAAFRSPTRKECLDIYDARFQGLDEAIKLVGGDPIKSGWIWTCERDVDPRYDVYNAWIFNGSYGYLNYTYVNYTNQVGAVTLLSER